MRTIYPGDYSYVAEMVENSFIQPSLRILLEYGLPQNAVETVRRVLKSSKLNIDKLTEEELFDYIKSNISVFRVEKVDGCCCTFRVLAANPDTTSLYPYVSTDSIFTMDCNCLCTIRCLNDTYVECL